MLSALGHISSALSHVVSPRSQHHNRLMNQHSSRNNNNNNNQISTHILFVCPVFSASVVPSRVTQAKTTKLGKETPKQEQWTNKQPKNRSKPNTVLLTQKWIITWVFCARLRVVPVGMEKGAGTLPGPHRFLFISRGNNRINHEQGGKHHYGIRIKAYITGFPSASESMFCSIS